MYEAKESERKILAEPPYNYNIEAIDLLDTESDKVRRGIPIDLPNTIVVCKYQSDLQEIKKCQKNGGIFGHNQPVQRSEKAGYAELNG